MTHFLGVDAPEGFEERGSSTVNGKYKYYTAEEIVLNGGSSYAEIDITSAQILDAHNTPIPLVTALRGSRDPIKSYYKDLMLCFEFTGGSVVYEAGTERGGEAQLSINDMGRETQILPILRTMSNFAIPNDTLVQIVKMSDIIDIYGNFDDVTLNFSTNPQIVNGNGTLKVKIFQYIENFG